VIYFCVYLKVVTYNLKALDCRQMLIFFTQIGKCRVKFADNVHDPFSQKNSRACLQWRISCYRMDSMRLPRCCSI